MQHLLEKYDTPAPRYTSYPTVPYWEADHTEIGAEEVIIQVTDPGIGIPVEDQAYLFRRFFRASNAAQVTDIGLGLYIAKSYVEMMQGRIEFSSVYGQGSTFRVIFKF